MIASSGATHSPETTALAYDGDPATRWTSGVPMEPTMAYWLTLDAPAMIAGISAQAADATDNPASWVVAILDSDAGHGRQDVATGSGPIVATWAAVRGQVVRLECTSADPQWWWSISGLTVDATDMVIEEPPIVPPVVPPAEPLPPDADDVTVGPGAYTEAQARWWLLYWAEKFGWPVRQRDGVDFTTGQVTVEQMVVYVVARARAQGILEPWPFTD
jgi:hypothetical protein